MDDLILKKDNTNNSVSNILETVSNIAILENKDLEFLQKNKQHLSKVLDKTYMWRTDLQKESIIDDNNHPTLHSKFHQAILEQKVQFEQSLYLGKDFEIKKLEIEELLLDIEDLTDSQRDKIKKKKLEIELQFKEFELSSMRNAMKYRMKEVKGWQNILDRLYKQMKDSGISDEDIWEKSQGELKSFFLRSLSNLQGIKSTTDGAERNNLMNLALFTYNKIKETGLLESVKLECNSLQIDSLNLIETLLKK